MLGTTTSQDLIKKDLSIGANSKATLEWNHNNYNRPRICGSVINSTSSGAAANSTTLLGTGKNFSTLTALGTWSQTTSAKSSDSINYGASSLSTKSNTAISLSNSFTSLFTFPASYQKSYKLSFYIKASDNTSDGIILKFIEKDSSGNDVGAITRSFSMNSIQWQLRKLNYRPVNKLTTTVLVSICREKDESNKLTASSPIMLSDITICEVKKYEYGIAGVYDVEDTFGAFRPGDEIAERGLDKNLSDIIYRSGIPQQFAGTYTAPSLTYKYVSPSPTTPLYLPGLNSFSYYAEPMTTKDVPVGVFAYYDKTLTTNKVVVKMLNSGPGTINTSYQNTIQAYSFYTYNASTNTWTNHGQVGSMNKNGSLILYWNGTSWDGTARIASVNETNFTLSGTTTIDGIAFTVSRIGYGTKVLGVDSILNQVSTADPNGGFDPTLRFLEISPRLIVDVSTYIEEYSVNKETDSGNMPTAVGLANANSASLKLENITRSYNGSTFGIFSDKTGISPFSKLNLIDKNVKTRISYDLLNSNGGTVESDIPFFVGYVESWDVDEESATLNLFDYSKILQRKNTADMLLFTNNNSSVSLTIGDCLKALFERNGFSDYNTFELNSTLLTTSLMAYYTDSQKNMWENIQELLLPYGYLGYFDEYGMFNLTNYKTRAGYASVFTFTDKYNSDGNNIQPNIISMNENANDRIGKVTVNYNSIYKKYSTDPASNSSTFTTVETPSTQILWEAGASEGVGFSNLKNGLDISGNTIELNQNIWNVEPEMSWLSYSGYAAIGTEIVKYNGQEISYSLTAQVTSASANGGTITYNARNNFRAGQYVTVTGLTNNTFNVTNLPITTVSETQFTVFVSGATGSVSLQAGTATVPVTEKSIVKNEADLQYVLSKIRGVSATNASYNWSFTGRLLNVERGMFGTQARYHVAPASMADVVDATRGYPELKLHDPIYFSNTSVPSTSVISPSNRCSIVLKDNISYMVFGGTSAYGGSAIAYLNGKDSQSYNHYYYSFYIPQTDTNNTDDVIVIPIGYNPTNPSLSYYLTIPAETNNSWSMALWYGGTVVAKSTDKLDTRDQIGTKKITTGRGRNKKTKTVKTYLYNKTKSVYIYIDPSNNMEVSLDGSKVSWFYKDKFIDTNGRASGGTTRTDSNPRQYQLNRTDSTGAVVTYNRTGRSIGMGALGMNQIAIDSITAWQDGDFAISQKFSNTVDLVNILHGGDSNINKEQPYFFGINPSVYGMQIYDVDLTSGPSFNQSVMKTTGSHEFKDNNSTEVTRIVKVPEEQSIVSVVASTPYKSKFIYLNVGESYIPLSGQGSGSFNPTKVYGYAIQKTGDIQYIAESDRMLPNDSEIQISSDWIQSKENAEDIAAIILNSSIVSGNSFDIEAFGNPLLTIGDVVKLKYYKTNNVSDNLYMVTKANTSYQNGFNSSFTLRRIT